MMKKNNPIITASLAVIVLLVWGIIIYQSLDYFFNQEIDIVEFDNKGMSSEMDLLLEKRVPSQIQYLNLENDPFSFEEKPIVITTTKPKVLVKKPVITLSYSVKGLIINKSERLVIIEDKDSGTTQFVHEGKTYKGIKIVKIEPSSVKISENGNIKTVELNN